LPFSSFGSGVSLRVNCSPKKDFSEEGASLSLPTLRILGRVSLRGLHVGLLGTV
jgi:hypothetical protein